VSSSRRAVRVKASAAWSKNERKRGMPWEAALSLMGDLASHPPLDPTPRATSAYPPPRAGKQLPMRRNRRGERPRHDLCPRMFAGEELPSDPPRPDSHRVHLCASPGFAIEVPSSRFVQPCAK
jgi:hypothetical protein